MEIEQILTAIKFKDSSVDSMLKLNDDTAEVLTLVVGDRFRNYKVRMWAIEALVLLGDKRAVTPIMQVLKDKEMNIRAAAVKALGVLGDEQVFDALADRLANDKSDMVRQIALIALRSMIKLEKPKSKLKLVEIAQILTKLVKNQDSWLFVNAIVVLGEIGDTTALPHLEQVSNPSTEVDLDYNFTTIGRLVEEVIENILLRSKLA